MKKSSIFLILLLAVAIGVIMSTVGDASQYVSFQQAKDNPNASFHVVGELVQPEKMEYNPEKDPNYFGFMMADTLGNIHKVVLRDTKPADFERSEKVVVVGKMEADHFEAAEVLTKCPSKYVEDEITVAKN